MKLIIQISSLFIVLVSLTWVTAPYSSAQNFQSDSLSSQPNKRVHSYATFVLFGEESLAEGDYYGSSVYFAKALKMDSTDLAVHYQYGTALVKYNAYQKAYKAFRELVKKDNGYNYPDAQFWMATMDKNLGNYKDAKENFSAYSNNTENKSGYLYEKAKQEILSCDYAMVMKGEQKEVSIFDLQGDINLPGSEFNPVMINDSTLYFSSLREGKRDRKNSISDVYSNIKIYQAEKQGSNDWKTTGALDTIINDFGIHAANGSLSPDNKRLYFTRCSEENVCAIYVSTLSDGKWQIPKKLNKDINLNGYTATQPMVAMVQGDEVLFFVTDRKGGIGKLDIWYSVLTARSNKITYGKTRPVEGRVNTKGDEITPYFDSNTNTLYFSSNWHYGFGGFDVFKSYGSYKRFTVPENLEQPYNSSANECYFSVNNDLTRGFFASNRTGSQSSEEEICCNDIYSFKAEKPPEKKDIEVLKRFLPASLYFHNDTPDPKSNKKQTKVNYLDMYNEYSAMKEMYKKECRKGLKGDEAKKEIEDIEDFFRDNLDKGFSDLQLFLDLLLTELQKGKRVQLTIRGYASPLAKTDYNINLTLRRISCLVNYIQTVDDGIFASYMNINAKDRGHLSLLKIPLGEHRADASVSSNLADKRSSVYSRAAALERKIEITSVDLEKK